MVFRIWISDPSTRDVARLEKSVKKIRVTSSGVTELLGALSRNFCLCSPPNKQPSNLEIV